MTEAEGIVDTGDSSPAAEIFRTLVSTFKSNVDDFMLRATQRHKELETLVHVHSFCEQVCVLSLLKGFLPIGCVIEVFLSHFSCLLSISLSLLCASCPI